MLEDQPSELTKTAKFVTGLLPSLNRKLRGKEYSSFAHAVEAVQISSTIPSAMLGSSCDSH
jgi:hypothetical protein